MDEKVLQCFVVATSLVSAVAAVLAFAQSGWKSTIRASLLVLGAGGMSYLVATPHDDAAIDRPEGGSLQGPLADQASGPVLSLSEPLPTASISSSAAPIRADQPFTPSYRRSAAAGVLPPPMPGIPTARPPSPPPAPSAASSASSWSSPLLSLLGLVGTPKALPVREPGLYLPAEVLECPRCGSPYSSSSDRTCGVKCPACSAIVDLMPAGRYFTIHCCCSNWIKSPIRYAEPGINGTSLQIRYYCPRCRAQATITRSTANRN